MVAVVLNSKSSRGKVTLIIPIAFSANAAHIMWINHFSSVKKKKSTFEIAKTATTNISDQFEFTSKH